MAETGTTQISATLNKIYGENLNQKFQLKGPKVLIGRAYNADIRLQHCSVSRKHCILICTNKGWTVQDNSSQNGTWVCGDKLVPNKARLLQCGDIIFLGPPCELPQAFCFDVNYASGEEIPKVEECVLENKIGVEASHEILPGMPDRPKEKKLLAAERNQRLFENKDHLESSCEGVNLPEQTPARETSLIEYDNSVIVLSPDKSCPDTEAAPIRSEVLESDNSLIEFFPVKSYPNTEAAPIIKKEVIEMPSSSTSTNKRKFLMQSPQITSTPIDKLKKPKRQCKPSKPEDVLTDESNKTHLGDQICEISSSAIDQVDVEDSQSLLDDKKDDVSDLSLKSKENKILKEQVALMSEKIKKLKNAKSHVLQKFKSVYEAKKQEHIAVQKHLKEDLQNCEQKVKKEILEKFEEDLICNICTELLIKPTVLECSHTFCEFCINEWKKKKNECPNCRRKIQTMTRVLTLENFIDKALQTLTPEQKEKREELMKERSAAESQQRKAQKHSPRSRRFRRRRAVAVPTRRPPAGSPARQSIEISQRRNLILPLQLPPMPPLSFYNGNYRIPEVLVSDSEMDTINIYLS